uniref:Uncharacterized protein n=1 Tax=Arundo donax TaxID=35708 RepID=A0A0A9A8A8_ARUDO
MARLCLTFRVFKGWTILCRQRPKIFSSLYWQPMRHQKASIQSSASYATSLTCLIQVLVCSL